MKYIQIVIIATLVFVNLTAVAFCREVNLYWEPSPSPDVIGYKVYYQSNSMQMPLLGTDAAEGPSPIDVESSLMARISGLQENTVYYFSVTAYDSQSNESGFSNIVSTVWMPPLLAPVDNASAVPLPVTFQWGAAPENQDVFYTLFYGTSRDQVTNAAITSPPINGGFNLGAPLPAVAPLVIVALLLTSLIFFRRVACERHTGWKIATVTMVTLGLVACGGGGGSGDGGSERSIVVTPSLARVETNNSLSYQAFDLEPGTTYYWKVDAVSADDPATVYHSQIFSFTTQQ